MLREAIDYYHSLLTDETAGQTQALINEQMHRQGLYFGTRPLTSVLRPRFFTREQYRLVCREMRPILTAFRKIHEAALADANFRAQFHLTEWEEELLQIDPGFRDPSPTARMDTFFLPDTGEMFLTEYNAETPAAPAYNDALSQAFMALPVMHAFEKKYEVLPLPAQHNMLHVILESYQEWGGQGRPTIAILDWREVPTYSEFVLFQRYFSSHGYHCIITDPRQVEYKNGKLWTDTGVQIDFIYKRVLISELYAQGGINHPVIRAVRDHAVCMVNPFRCKMLYKKASLAVLSDDMNAHLFNAPELKAIQAHIPWTRLLSERHTTYEGAMVDLLPFLRANKDQFVLKPNDDYGGRGIVLGWTVSQGDWEHALEVAVKNPSIVQKRIPLPSEPYPSLVNGKLQIYDRLFDTAPFIWHGDFVSSCLTRLSTDPLLNVTAGGGSTVPTFIIEERG